MVFAAKSIGTLVLRLIVALALLACPRMGSAAGTWSVVSFPHKPGEVYGPTAVTVDTAGNLYVADGFKNGQIQERDAQGNWSVIATYGTAPGQIGYVDGLAVDAAGNLYVADVLDWNTGIGRIQKRDAQGNWSVLDDADHARTGALAVDTAGALAVDTAGNLYYVADYGTPYGRIQERDVQGNWSILAAEGLAPGQVQHPTALAVDTAGSLYVAEYGTGGRIQRRDAQGNWSVIAIFGTDPGQVSYPTALAVDTTGNLYVADRWYNGVWNDRIQKRDAQGNWSVIATAGQAQDPFSGVAALAVDAAGNLYVVDASPGIQKRDAQGNWSVIPQAGDGWALAVDTAGNLYVGGDGIQKRDPQGNWSVIDTGGSDIGQAGYLSALAVDAAGNLYVGVQYSDDLRGIQPTNLIQKRDAQGNWSDIATKGRDLGQIFNLVGLAVDGAGDLYVADLGQGIQKRDAQGNWSVIDTGGSDIGDGYFSALAVDTAGNLYVAEYGTGGRIQRRDAQGNWSVIATAGRALGQVDLSDGGALAVDGAGNLYVADTGNDRVLKYTPRP